MGYSSALIIRMSLFCIVWSKNSHRTCISVGSSALSSSSAESVQRQNMKALNTHRHTLTKSVCLLLKYIHMQTHTVHLHFPLSNIPHPQTITHRHTEKVPLVIYSLCCVRVCWLSLNVLTLCVRARSQRKHKCAYVITKMWSVCRQVGIVVCIFERVYQKVSCQL